MKNRKGSSHDSGRKPSMQAQSSLPCFGGYGFAPCRFNGLKLSGKKFRWLMNINLFHIYKKACRNFYRAWCFYLLLFQVMHRCEQSCVPFPFIFFKEIYMIKWIIPIACATVLAACSTGSGRMSTAPASGSDASSTMSSGSSGSSGGQYSGAMTKETSPTTSGSIPSAGTANVPGSKGTAGAPVDPNAPGSTGPNTPAR